MIPVIEAQPDEIYDIELEHSLLEANAKLAKENRALLDRHGTTAIDFMGAIGSGKTTLIAKLVEKLKGKLGVAVFNGDATTSEDADAIARQNVPVVQIATINGCHLDANLVGKGLNQIELGPVKLLFIENIGNLICPAEFPLGSKARVVVVSVTEGPWSSANRIAGHVGRDDCGSGSEGGRTKSGSKRRLFSKSVSYRTISVAIARGRVSAVLASACPSE